MSPPFLTISDLHKGFGTQSVLAGLNLEIERGSVTTVMGKSGIGKSVLLKCIAGIHRPDAGRILLLGSPCIGAHCGKDSPKLSYLFQGNALFDSLTAAENVMLPLVETSRLSRPEARRRVTSLFEQLDLGNVARKFPGEISGGMQKRVALARALITEPQLILFDEPTTGLDPQRKNSVFAMIADYRRRFDFTALIVSHDIPEALYVSDRVAWLDGGRFRFVGSPLELENADEPELLDFIHHRNGLFSAVAGRRDRGELFADWPALRARFRKFAVVTGQPERRHPGGELGLQRFAQAREAMARLDALSWEHSEIYLLDERHFGFAFNAPAQADDFLTGEIARLLHSNAAGASYHGVTYRWESQLLDLEALTRPQALWETQPQTFQTTAPFKL